MTSTDIATSSRSRRSIVKAAAWSMPVIAAAAAAPAASASDPTIDIGNFSFVTWCEPSQEAAFRIRASQTAPLPAGTLIYFSWTNGARLASGATSGPLYIDGFTGTSFLVTVTSDWPGDISLFLTMRDDVTDFSITGVITLPPGYIGTGSVPSASINFAQGACVAP